MPPSLTSPCMQRQPTIKPIGIGDLVTFTAKVVHCTSNTCRVIVTVEVCCRRLIFNCNTNTATTATTATNYHRHKLPPVTTTCRHTQVRDPADAGRLPTRSNRLLFAFALDNPNDSDSDGVIDDGKSSLRSMYLLRGTSLLLFVISTKREKKKRKKKTENKRKLHRQV